ncbi:MAG TPA: ABC transporter permease subunit [Symbiobacteriaceae bacterium]|nr:ABC transporter permease subunit [Symbiobacteriaceae bacterium]
MTLFRQFFSAQFKGLLIWMAVGALFAFAGTRSAAPFIDGNAFATLPPAMLALFGNTAGLQPVDMYLTVIVGKGTILIPTLFAVIVALSVVTREVDRRTVEFLLGLPVQRTQVLAARVAVMFVNLTAVTGTIWAVLRFDLAAQGYQGTWAHLNMLFLNIWLLAAALGTITLAVSMWIDDYSVGVKLFLGLVTLGYFIEYVLKGATVSRAGRILSPFSYVDIGGVMRWGTIATGDALVLIAAIAIGLAVSFRAFDRKQFSA